MTGALYEGDHGFYLACAARILDDSKELAWAEKYYVANEFHKFIVGRYVESDKANFNRQHFTFDNLKFGQPTLANAPVNLNHGNMMVGSFIASEIVYPTQATADDADLNPYMDALSVFWKHYFENEYAIVETAHRANRLFYSMECLPQEISCSGDKGCGRTFEYGGRQSPGYCDELNDPHSGVIKDLIKPHFTAGALIIPPAKPGWGKADVTQISQIVREHADAAEELYKQIAEESPEGDPRFWEQVMAFIILKAEMGDELAKKRKKVMPSGY